MAKTGLVGYFNPTVPFIVKDDKRNDVVNPTFWRLWLQQLQTQAQAQIDLATDVFGTLPIANGGTNANNANTAFANLSPMTTRGDLITRNATVPIRLAIGSAARILTSDGVDASWQPASVAVGGRFAPVMLLMGA